MIWTMLGATLLAATAIGVVTAHSESKPASEAKPTAMSSGCTDLNASRSAVRTLENEGSAAVMQDLEGEEAQTWIAALNSYPPHTNYAGDAVIAVVTTESDGVMVALFEDGCHTLGGVLPAEVYLDVAKAVELVRPST